MSRATSAPCAASGRTKIHHRVDGVIPEQDLQRALVLVGGCRRIVSTGLAVEASEGRISASRARVASESVAIRSPAGVRAQDRRSAGVGQDRHAVSRRQRRTSEQPRDVEHLPDRLSAQHPGAREQRVDGHAEAASSAPVREDAAR